MLVILVTNELLGDKPNACQTTCGNGMIIACENPPCSTYPNYVVCGDYKLSCP